MSDILTREEFESEINHANLRVCGHNPFTRLLRNDIAQRAEIERLTKDLQSVAEAYQRLCVSLETVSQERDAAVTDANKYRGALISAHKRIAAME